MNALSVGVLRGSRWVCRLVAVNLLWILFTLLGLVVGGVMPATAAAFAVVRGWSLDEGEAPIYRRFVRAYRAEFWRSNLLGYILVVMGYLVYTDFTVSRSQQGVVNLIVSLIFIVVLVCYVMTVTYVFPLLVHVELSSVDYLKYSLCLGLGRPLLTLLALAGTFAFLAISARWAVVLLPFLGISIPVWIITKCAHIGIRQMFAGDPSDRSGQLASFGA